MRNLVAKIVALVSLFTLTAVSSAQQAGAPLSKQAQAVKRKADQLQPRAPISVVRVHADEEFGEFVSSAAEGFTFYDIDRKGDVTLRYTEVRKIKDGYGGYNSVRGRHTDRTKGLIAAVVILGALGGLLIAVATAKD